MTYARDSGLLGCMGKKTTQDNEGVTELPVEAAEPSPVELAPREFIEKSVPGIVVPVLACLSCATIRLAHAGKAGVELCFCVEHQPA